MPTGERAMNVYNRTKRLRQFLVWFVERHKPKCFICEQRITEESIGGWCDDLILHHEDEDRTHNEAENLLLVHKGCHRYWHWAIKAKAKGKNVSLKPKLCQHCHRRVVEPGKKKDRCAECRRGARAERKAAEKEARKAERKARREAVCA